MHRLTQVCVPELVQEMTLSTVALETTSSMEAMETTRSWVAKVCGI